VSRVFRDPTALTRRIKLIDELRTNLRDHRLERDIPTLFLRIERTMPRDHPADVAGTVGAEAIQVFPSPLEGEGARRAGGGDAQLSIHV
jgi:hypothetical protein